MTRAHEDMDDISDTDMDEEGYCGERFIASGDFIEVGKVYQSKKHLQDAVENTASHKSYGYRVRKSNKERYKVKCVDPQCAWQMMASIIKGTNNFVVRKITDKHTCAFDIRFKKKHKPSYISIADKIRTR